MWVWPTLAGLLGLVVGLLAVHVDLPVVWDDRLWPGSIDSASAMAQTVATAVVTVTSVTFTLTVVALQLSSQQFSPRLLREFSRDRVVKAVLAVLVGTFVLALTVLRAIGVQDTAPALASLLVYMTGVGSLVAVLGFLTHLVRILRIDTLMLAVHNETAKAIDVSFPSVDDGAGRDVPLDPLPGTPGRLVLAVESGFVRTVAVEALVEAAHEHDVLVRLLVRPGDHVVEGTPVAEAWLAHPPHGHPGGEVEGIVRTALGVGYERTLEQDAAYGFRQLEDIAVKALSPGINDPVTAVHAVGHLAQLLVRLTRYRLGAGVHRDADGVARAVVPDRDFRYYLDLSCAQVRRYGRSEPTVLAALLRLLRDVAASARDDEQRTQILRAAELVCEAADPKLLEDERTLLSGLHGGVQRALRGDLLGAYTDRSGETRSI